LQIQEVGVIILGIKEDKETKICSLEGVENANNILKDFWNTINNNEKVSCNILNDDYVEVTKIEDKTIVIINIPSANRQNKPVYINNNPITGTYKRYHDGDYKCNKKEVKVMFSESSEESKDEMILKEFDFDNIDKETLVEHDKYSKFLVGKPDSVDLLEKKLIILAISRKVFTHSLPLITAEQCYEQLLNEARSELVHSKNDRKARKAYKMLLTIIEEYNVNLLSTKIYWERPKDREEYKKFWDKFKKIITLEEKEILLIKNDLEKISNKPQRYKLVINAYKKKLVELGVKKEVKDKTSTKEGKHVKKNAKTKQKAKTEKEEKKIKKETVKAKTKVEKSTKKENETVTSEPKRRGRPRKNA